MFEKIIMKSYKFMLDYHCNCLWGINHEAQDKFCYHIDDLYELGLSEQVINLNDLVSDLYTKQLNPIYQADISFWSGEMHKYFQEKVKQLYNEIIEEIGNKCEINIHEDTQKIIERNINILEINENVQEYINKQGKCIYTIEKCFTSVETEYEKWVKEENEILRDKKL